MAAALAAGVATALPTVAVGAVAALVSPQVVLVPLDFSGPVPLALVPRGREATLFGEEAQGALRVDGAARSAAPKAAQRLLESLVVGEDGAAPAHCWLAGVVQQHLMVVAAPLHLPLRGGWRCETWQERAAAEGDPEAPPALWCSTRALHGRPEQRVVRAAMLKCRELVSPWADARGEIVSGALQRTLVGGGASAEAQAPRRDTSARCREAAAGLDAVCAGLEAAAAEYPDIGETLLLWRDRVLCAPVGDIPEEVLALSRDEAALEWLCVQPFMSGLSIPPAERLPLPLEQEPLPDGVPLPPTALETYEPWARAEIIDSLRENAQWHRRGGAADERPQPAAWGEDARLPQFRGRVLDYTRGRGQGRLMRMAARATSSRLHMAAVDRYFGCSRNQRPFGFMRQGCQLGAELPLQTVVGPQLLDLYRVEGGIDAVANESENMLSRGFWVEGP